MTRLTTLHPAKCDSCLKDIRGIRYKCIDLSCPDFDLCEICARYDIHPWQHHMLLSRFPRVFQAEDLAMYRDWTAVHFPLSTVRGVHQCFSCSTKILGTFYMCMDQDCPDFHLCTQSLPRLCTQKFFGLSEAPSLMSPRTSYTSP
ncbi:hypothetical protein B0H14DRAFT_1632196 [Mycena olivaceomarginata]|nr:hypothetical protein B0H14DRAFT_1632196 [Mycena olivaceomarginata]